MSLTRRELLSALLGAPLALTECQRRPREYPGQLLGARSDVGHRLLDATVERVGSGEPERVPIAIVGAGPSGLSAAWQLLRRGEKQFRIFELEPRPGGTSAYGTSGVVPHPWGAHYVPVPTSAQPDLVTLLEELGAVTRTAEGRVLGREHALVRAPEERLFIDGEWREGLFPASRAARPDLDELARFEGIVARYEAFRDGAGRRAFSLPVRGCSDAEEIVALDRISAARWFDEQGFRSPLLRWYLEYACRDDYGASLAGTSAWALLFYFCARVTEAGQPSAPFLTWPEGNGRIVEHLRRKVGDRLALNQLVTDVVPGADGVDFVAYDASTHTARHYRADDVVLAVPKLVARRVLRPFREAPPAHLEAFRYGAWLVANLHLSGRPGSRGFPMAWDNVLFDSKALGYVVASHQTLADLGPTVWTYYRPFFEFGEHDARRVLHALDHRTAAQAVIADLRQAHADLDQFVERIDIYRWGHAMVTPYPGFMFGEARRKAAEAVGRVVFAHSDLSGIPLFEEAFDRGILAADSVLSRRR